ncbi:hypothetical protein QBC44DRAFT_360855 [Cladorrhinum sp. PSN332]|nr:hypothetical protein QBC44DRAFT_360855 [Cladorrhinum sp. PSN332]
MKQKKILREARKAAKRQARDARQPTAQLTGLREVVLFSTVELLERVLLELDMRTILTVAQRVHPHWHKVITTSPAIQQHLFFRPINVPSGSSPIPIQNPLLASDFYAFFRTWAPKARATIWQHRDRVLPLSFRPTGDIDSFILWNTLPGFRDMANKKKHHLALTRPDASWRRMLVSQPPPKRIGRVKEWGPDQVYRHWDRKMVDVKDGLRMGDLYDVVDAVLWRRFARVERHKKMSRYYHSEVWIGWKCGTNEEVESLGINPDGRPWGYATSELLEMPQPSPKGDQWVEEEEIDLVIGERSGEQAGPGRCRGHGLSFGRPLASKGECCGESGIAPLPGEKYAPLSRLWRDGYNEDSARWMFACQERNDELVEKLGMEEVGEPEESRPNSPYLYRFY